MSCLFFALALNSNIRLREDNETDICAVWCGKREQNEGHAMKLLARIVNHSKSPDALCSKTDSQ